MTFNPDSPLNRIPGESRKANQALVDYALMGAGRNLRGLLEGYVKQASNESQTTKPPTLKWLSISTWSIRFHWVDRVTRFDELEQEARLAERKKRRQQLEEADWVTGEKLRQRVGEFLEQLPKFIKTSESVTVEDTIDPVSKQPMKRETRVITVGLNTNLGQLANALKAATELQRLATGEATQRTEVTGTVFNITDWREKRQSRLDDVAGIEECGT